MTSFSRILSGLVLGFYLALIGIQTFHTHTTTTMAADTHAECQICKIAHQSPSLINPAAIPQTQFLIAARTINEIPLAAFQVVFRSYGPAPPTV